MPPGERAEVLGRHDMFPLDTTGALVVLARFGPGIAGFIPAAGPVNHVAFVGIGVVAAAVEGDLMVLIDVFEEALRLGEGWTGCP